MGHDTARRLAPAPRAFRADRLAWLALTLLAFALRAHQLAGQCLWSDEDITLDRARLPVRELLANLPVEHPPLYFLASHAWIRLAGDGDFALRFPSLMAGVVAVVLAGYVGARLVGRRVGLLTGLVMAVNPFQVWYGQEARMYTLLEAAALGALACVLRAETSDRPRRWWCAAGACTALAVYSHYYGALVAIVLVAWGVIDVVRQGRTVLGGWLVAGATALLLFGPWLPRAAGVLGFPGWRVPAPLASIPWTVLSAWSAGTTLPADQALPITALFLVLAVVGVAALARRARRPAGQGPLRALIYLGVPLAVVVLVLLKAHDFHPRYFFAALPALALVVASGLDALPRPLPGLATGLVVLAAVPALAHLYTDPQYQKQDYRAFLHTVEVAAGHEDTVLFLDGPALGLARRYEVPKSAVKIVNVRKDAGDPPADKVASRVAELASDYPHLWLAEDGGANGYAQHALDANAFPVTTSSFQDVRLARYFVSPAEGADVVQSPGFLPASDDFPMDLSFGTASQPSTVRSGQVLPVRLLWEPREPLTRTLQVSVRLIDPNHPDAPAIAAVDRLPTNGRVPMTAWTPGQALEDRQGLLVPAGTPPGTYQLAVVLYEAGTLREVAAWRGPAVTVEPPP